MILYTEDLTVFEAEEFILVLNSVGAFAALLVYRHFLLLSFPCEIYVELSEMFNPNLEKVMRFLSIIVTTLEISYEFPHPVNDIHLRCSNFIRGFLPRFFNLTVVL